MAIMFIAPAFNHLTNPVDRWRPLTPNTFFFPSGNYYYLVEQVPKLEAKVKFIAAVINFLLENFNAGLQLNFSIFTQLFLLFFIFKLNVYYIFFS